jgi:ABC transporter substrate binding protein
LGLQLQPLGARGPGEIDIAFAAMTREQAGAVIILVDAMLSDHRPRIVELAARRRLPTVYGLMDYADARGLVAFASSDNERFRRAAAFVDKILKGAKPADLPVEQPTKFELDRPPRPWASRSRPRCCCARITSSNEFAVSEVCQNYRILLGATENRRRRRA